MIETDLLVIGAGPVGLFAVFEAGLLGMRCHFIDVLTKPGGQCQELYPKKPIFDIPGYPEVLGETLVANLLEQGRQFMPGFTLGERAERIEKQPDGYFIVTTNKGTLHRAQFVVIAGGLGCFEPRKPDLAHLDRFEDQGVYYMVKRPEDFADQRVVIAGGGDSALDWTMALAPLTKELHLVHRRDSFRGMPDSVSKVQAFARKGVVRVWTPSEVTALHGDRRLASVDIQTQDQLQNIEVDAFLPLFGLSPKLGPLAEWGLDLDGQSIVVDTTTFATSVPGVYAIGDINTYPGKLKLILCGFHEATMMCHALNAIRHPEKKHKLRYTTVAGVTGFDGSVKTAPRSVVTSLNGRKD